MAPSRSREEADPASEVTPLNGAATSAATTAAPSVVAMARAWARSGATTIRVTNPAAQANSAPREKLMYRPRPRTGDAAAARARRAGGRERSPARRAASTKPIAATSPIAFQ